MANITTLTYIKEYGLDSNQIFELLKMPTYPKKLNTVVFNNVVIMNGDGFNCLITFYTDHYIIQKQYRDYKTYEFRNVQDQTTEQITEFYINDEKITFSQSFQGETAQELVRSIALSNRLTNRMKFRRCIYSDETFNSSESYKAYVTERGVIAHRTIRDDDNVILTNYHDFTEPPYNKPIVGHIASTVSILPPAVVNYLMPVTNPDQLAKISNYENPTIVIDGSFSDLSTVDNNGKIRNHLSYNLLAIKQYPDYQVLLHINDCGRESTNLISIPCRGNAITFESIDRLIGRLFKTGFLRNHESEFPVEKRIIEELVRIKRDIIRNVGIDSLDFDYFECNLNQPNSYEEMAFDIYEHLHEYYNVIQQELAHEQNIAPFKL